MRASSIAPRLLRGREIADVLAARLMRAQEAHLRQRQTRLTALTRLLDSVSYRSVLARGFALVKGADGHVRRSASSLVAAEALTLTFADGEAQAVVSGKPARARAEKAKPGQGDLF